MNSPECEHRIRMTEFDIRNSLRALARVGTSSKERKNVFEHLLLLQRRAVMAQMKGEARTRVTGKLSNGEIAVIADALRECGMYPNSKFVRKMQLYQNAVERGMRFGEAWNLEVRRRKIERRSSRDCTGDQVDKQECEGHHREHGDWGRLLDQDGGKVYEDLSRGDDGWLYNDDGLKVERWREGSD